MAVQERYTPVVVGVNASVTLKGTSLGGFVAKTSGTITVIDGAGTTIVDAVPVTAGNYHPLPFYMNGGGTVTTASGASGTLGVT